MIMLHVINLHDRSWPISTPDRMCGRQITRTYGAPRKLRAVSDKVSLNLKSSLVIRTCVVDALAALMWRTLAAYFCGPLFSQCRYSATSQEHAFDWGNRRLRVDVSAGDTGTKRSGSFDGDVCRSRS